MKNNYETISNLLLEYKKQSNVDYLFPVLEPEAKKMIPSNPYAFCVATCLDRGTKADIIWTIPYWIFQKVGHFDPNIFYQMPISEVNKIFYQLPKKPRFIDKAAHTFQSITKIIVDQFDYDASNIWRNKKASEVKRTFMNVYGVGNGISNMAVILIENAFGIQFSDLDHSRMDIKPDVHTMRVLYRLGVAAYIEENEAISSARLLSPEYPGEIDGPLWLIGRNWCKANNPICNDCFLNNVCPRIDL